MQEDLKLIIGLGNKGEEYKFTRHNIGFIFIDYLVKNLYQNKEFKLNKTLNCFLIKESNLIFAKANNYINLSGNVIAKIKNHYKIENKNIFIIQDDIEKPLGTYKIAFKQEGTGGHNGIRSIHSSVGKDIYRVKIAIGKETQEYNNSVSDFVLSNFKKEELAKIEDIFPKIQEDLLKILNTNYIRSI